MKTIHFIKNLLMITGVFFLFSFVGVPEDINKALKVGDANVLKQKMNNSVELVILEKENVYSNTQAEQVLKKFFSANKPVSFEILHNGGSKTSQYYIGTLKTERDSFRVYYLLKNKGNESKIFQLRIEKDE